MTTQTVSETPNVEPEQVSTEAEPTAQDNLDALLNEYSEPETPETTPESSPQTVSTDELAEFRQMLDQNRETQLKQGLQESAALVKQAAGESASNIPDWMFVGALREEATNNPVVERIFNERGQNPEAWSKVAAALGKKISESLTVTDQASTDSWNAVDGAMHSSSKSTPTPKTEPTSADLSNMTDSEFAAHKKQLGY